MFAKLHSAGLYGMDAFVVEVETYVSGGLARFDIVGLPDTAVKESRDRVRSSMKNRGFDYPNSRITVNLAPADLKKAGPLYDLPILISILLATEQIRFDVSDCMFIGELSLSGDIRPANGVLPMVIKARQSGFKRVFVPAQNAAEGAVVDGIEVYPVTDINALISHFMEFDKIEPAKPDFDTDTIENQFLDFADVKGQEIPKRAMEISAAGGHNIMLIGPPGSGKSMLAKRMPSILPDMTFEESIETTKLHSIAGVLNKRTPLITVRPFRSPHHTVSPVALTGGGTMPKPGEISLAHNGVLFLDELPEFSRKTMEVLRQPLEDGKVSIARVAGTLTYPCDVIMVAAMNPCPCGFSGHPTKQCKCAPGAAQKYINKISGPLLDRIDLHVEVPPVDFDQLNTRRSSITSADMKARVNAARAIQHERYKDLNIRSNAVIPTKHLHDMCPMTESATALLKAVFTNLGLSARAYDRILKVARTIADLEAQPIISEEHIAEAVNYRSLDKKYWRM